MILERPPTGALARAKRIADLLKDAARISKLSRRRRDYDASAFGRRRGARVMRAGLMGTFILFFVAPSISALCYFGLIASPQYLAEARFTVQGGDPPKMDGIGLITGFPSLMVIQDTQVVANYLRSQTIVEALHARLNLRSVYGSPAHDWFARFDRDEPIERLVDYWKDASDVSIQLPSGIVTIKVRAFSPHDALRITEEVLRLSEALVNDMNARMRRDSVNASEAELARATRRVSQTRLAIQQARDKEGVLDTAYAGKALVDLITSRRSLLLDMQREYERNLKDVLPSAPQMKSLEAQIRIEVNNIRDLEARLTTANSASERGREVLSGSMARFSELELEHRIAEKQYTAAAASLRLAQIAAERQFIFLQTFLKPSLPEEARYPRRGLSILLVSAGSFLLWSLLVGVATLIRNHMA